MATTKTTELTTTTKAITKADRTTKTRTTTRIVTITTMKKATDTMRILRIGITSRRTRITNESMKEKERRIKEKVVILLWNPLQKKCKLRSQSMLGNIDQFVFKIILIYLYYNIE